MKGLNGFPISMPQGLLLLAEFSLAEWTSRLFFTQRLITRTCPKDPKGRPF